MLKHGPAKCKHCHGEHHSLVHAEHFSHESKPTEDEELDDEDLSVAEFKTWKKKKAAAAKVAASMAKSGKAKGTGSAAAKTAKLGEDLYWDGSDEEGDSEDDLVSRLSEYSFSARCAVTNHDTNCYRDVNLPTGPPSMPIGTGPDSVTRRHIPVVLKVYVSRR